MPKSWDIDLNTGHMAHPSGLHAYILNNECQRSDTILCIGPFSSHAHGLRHEEVFQYTADVITRLEALDRFDGRFTYWGSLSSNIDSSLSYVEVMGHEYGLIPNPSFRSSVLISSGRTSTDPTLLLREWQPRDNLTGIDHRLGARFTFPLKDRKRYRVKGQVDKLPEDILSLAPVLRSVTIKVLGSLALGVLSQFGADFSRSKFRTLELNSVENQI